MKPPLLRCLLLLSLLLTPVLLAGACGASESARSTCEQYRDEAIERRLDKVALPNPEAAAELDKHRSILMRVHGERLINECERTRAGAR